MNIHLEQLKLTIRNAWLTLSMLPDPDARFRRAFSSGWVLPTVRSVKDGDYPQEIYTKMIPSPQEITEMEAVFDWMVWLRGIEGEYAIKRIAAWALGEPIWKMAQRERCTEKTIRNRIDRSIAKISDKFKEATVEIAAIEEHEPRPERIRGFGDRATADLPDNLEPGRIYVAGIGMMFRGEKYRSPLDVDEKSCGKPRR